MMAAPPSAVGHFKAPLPGASTTLPHRHVVACMTCKIQASLMPAIAILLEGTPQNAELKHNDIAEGFSFRQGRGTVFGVSSADFARRVSILRTTIQVKNRASHL